MQKFTRNLVALLCTGMLATQLLHAQGMSNTVMVGGGAMYPQKDIIDNAMQSKDHTTLVAAVQAAGLVPTLKGNGPFTVFAPTDDAFEDLPAGTVDNLLKPENKSKLSGILTYHVVAGRYTFDDLAQMIRKGNGMATLQTVNGEPLTFMMNGMHNIQIKDASGHVANITTYDVMQSNGVIHVIDRVLLP